MDNNNFHASVSPNDSGYNPDFFHPNRMSESVYRLLDQLDVDPQVLNDIKKEFQSAPEQSNAASSTPQSFSDELSSSMPSLAEQLYDAMPTSGASGQLGKTEGFYA